MHKTMMGHGAWLDRQAASRRGGRVHLNLSSSGLALVVGLDKSIGQQALLVRLFLLYSTTRRRRGRHGGAG